MTKHLHNLILNTETKQKAIKFFNKVIETGIDFKLQEKVTKKHLSSDEGVLMIKPLLNKGKPLGRLLKEFQEEILPYCTNFSSSHFLGFPDSGNSIAGLGGAILYNFIQQNLINQSFCAPIATFKEIEVIRWLRETVGYKNIEASKIKSIWDVGGVITTGGTASNSIGMLLARENHKPGTIEKGVVSPHNFKLIVPKGIGHYSVKSSQMWLGCGDNLIEVNTNNFKYDLDELYKTLKINRGKVMSVVVYVGDSRTMTVDNLPKIIEIVKNVDPKIWLHADSCHGFSLGFSKKLRTKIVGLNKFDSISTDPHKVLLTPYVISALLIKDPIKFKTITSKSDLIMQEDFAFGQITPFYGSRAWDSLKLWFMMNNLGKDGLDSLINERHNKAIQFSKMLNANKNFIVLNKVDINSVMFIYTGNLDQNNIKLLNSINIKIHDYLLREGRFHLHQFSIEDPRKGGKGEILKPLRYMCGNPNTQLSDLKELIFYLEKLGRKITRNERVNL